MLIIGGNLLVDPAQSEAFTDDLRALASHALAAGALFFAVAVENKVEGRVLVLERWPTKETLNAFLAQEHAQHFFRAWGQQMRNELFKFDASNQRPSQSD